MKQNSTRKRSWSKELEALREHPLERASRLQRGSRIVVTEEEIDDSEPECIAPSHFRSLVTRAGGDGSDGGEMVGASSREPMLCNSSVISSASSVGRKRTRVVGVSKSWVYCWFEEGKINNEWICLLPRATGTKHFTTVKAESSTNLMTHVQRHHAPLLAKIMNTCQDEVSRCNMAKELLKSERSEVEQLKLVADMKWKQFRQIGDRDFQDMALVVWAARYAIPWHAIDSDDFRRYISSHPTTVPSRRKLGDVILPRAMHVAVQAEMERLQTADFVNCTTDGWSDPTRRGFISLTLHFLTPNMEMVSINRDLIPMSSSHDAENLASALWKRIEERVPEETVLCVLTTDGAPAQQKANKIIVMSEMDSFHCMNHRLQLVIRHAIDDCQEAKKAVQDVTTLVRTVRASSTLQQGLLDAQGVPHPKMLIMNVETRWQSDYHMLERFIDLGAVLVGLKTDWPVPVTASLISKVLVIKELLHPFAEVSFAAEQDKVLTMPHVPQWLLRLRRHLQSQDIAEVPLRGTLQAALLRHFEFYFACEIDAVSLPLCAAALHPCYGHLGFVSKDLRGAVHQALRKEAQLIFPSPIVPIVHAELSYVFELFASSDFARDVDAPAWWRDCTAVTHAKKIARIFLSIMATSASSERLFSSSGYEISGRSRSCLTESHLEQLVATRSLALCHAPFDALMHAYRQVGLTSS